MKQESKITLNDIKKPLISIIIPVYNVEKFLNSCLDSVINQTYQNLEIMCVNDGSTDNSLKILEQYAQKEPRINIINQSNKGLAGARNTALDALNGEYFFFLDSDDFIHPQTIEILYSEIKKDDSDIICCDFQRTSNLYKDTSFESLQEPYISTIIDKPLIEFTKIKSKLSPSVWTNLYKTKKFGDIRFVEGYVWEDVFYTIQCFDRIEKIKCLNVKLYKYMQNPNSISLYKYSKNKIDSHIKNIQLIDNYFNNNNKQIEIKEKLIAISLRRVLNDVKHSKDIELRQYLKPELRILKKNRIISYKYLKVTKWLDLWQYLNL